MKIAVYPGSFDPISNGHLDIIRRAAKVFDKLYVVVSVNPVKSYCFTTDERVYMLKTATKDLNNVEIEYDDGLVLNYAKSRNANVIIRGLRNIFDYENEISLFQFNHTIDNSIDTFVLFPSSNNLFLSSSSIKELVKFNSDISPYVPSELVEYIREKINNNMYKKNK